MKLRLPWITLSLAGVAVVLHLIPGAAALLQFDRTALAAGEWWRGLTGHLVHFNANHLAWDVFALLLLGSWAEMISRRGTVLTLLLSAPAISAAVWRFQPEFSVYRGLSGVDSALIGLAIAGLVQRARVSRDTGTVATAAVAALLFVGKSGFELATGGTLFADSSPDFTAVPLAHLVGFATGVASALICSRGRRPRGGRRFPHRRRSSIWKSTTTSLRGQRPRLQPAIR